MQNEILVIVFNEKKNTYIFKKNQTKIFFINIGTIPSVILVQYYSRCTHACTFLNIEIIEL